ncbi:MAG: Gfo/Idh/MocA family oxidoreductase [Planctomycetes bacterium]|nr:Gfo/Idh/MocA family oxidoreductase [Planctomycetota bacterium]
MTLDRIGIGIVGTGFLAETRARCYARVAGKARLAAVCSREPVKATDWAARHGIAEISKSYDDLLARDDVAMVDLCVPNHLHRPFTERAARAGKHVVCTKPLTAYVGQDLPEEISDEAIAKRPREEMLAVVTQDAQAMVDACDAAGVRLMYGENWVYAPGMRRAAAMTAASDGVILEMRGFESHMGSHSPYAKRWRHTGGGALLRLGAHPIGAMLHLKTAEGIRLQGRAIKPVAVTAEVADLTKNAALTASNTRIATGWHDVENWGSVIIHFEDGSRGLAWGSDNLLGGMESRLTILASNHHLEVNLSPHDLVRAYASTPGTFQGAYIMEKCDTDAGWTTPLPDEDWTSGHAAMCEDFVDALREGREALADGRLGLEVTRLVYAAYLSAERGARVTLEP